MALVPAADNSDGTIFGGYGQLVNVTSGECLEVNGAGQAITATVDQWTCGDGAANELWRAIQGSG